VDLTAAANAAAAANALGRAAAQQVGIYIYLFGCVVNTVDVDLLVSIPVLSSPPLFCSLSWLNRRKKVKVSER